MEIEDSFRAISPTNPYLEKISVELNEDSNPALITACQTANKDFENMGFDPISDLDNIEKVINSFSDNQLEQDKHNLGKNAGNDSDLEIMADGGDELLLGSQLLRRKYTDVDVHKDCRTQALREKQIRLQLQSELELERQQRIQFQQQLQEFMQLSLQRQFDDSRQIKQLKFELLKCKQELVLLKTSQNHNNTSNGSNSEDSARLVFPKEPTHKDFSCIDCTQVMKSEISMILHMINHSVHESDFHLSTTVFKLDEFTNSMTDTVRRSFSYSCPRCNLSFNCIDIYYHLYKCHTKEQPLMCTTCNVYCTHLDYLRTHHQEAHGGIIQNITYANISINRQRLQVTKTLNNGVNNSNTFRPYNVNLRSHMKASNPSVSSSPYTNNNSGLSSSDNASDDLEVINLSDSPPPAVQSTSAQKPSNYNPKAVAQTEIECTFADCDFKTSSKEKLDFHISAHTNSKFKCPYCPYVGNVLNDIYRHIQKSKKHEGLKIYECRECEYGTNCLSTFKEHLTKRHFGNESDDEEDINDYITNMFRNEHSAHSDKSDSS